ncbi:hypothetical protein ACU8L5_25520 (plasmid) [Rhizobium leguminosarum]
MSLFRIARSKNEILAHEWMSLRMLWNATKEESKISEERKNLNENTLCEDEVKRIDALFPEVAIWQSGAQEWHDLNTATQEVGRRLLRSQLKTEFPILLALAQQRKLANYDVHAQNATLFSESSADALSQMRAAYLALLDDLQRWFINTRFNRSLRREVAERLLSIGVWVAVIAIAPFIVFFYMFYNNSQMNKAAVGVANGYQLFSSNPVFGLAMVAAFGLLGAYFSRVVMFQGQIATLGFDDVMTSYQALLLYVRLLVGMIGAIVFYFLLRSEIIAGSAFPDLSKLGIGEQVVWKVTAANGVAPVADGTPDPSGLTILMPTIDLAKLLVWSFLAGFSERLVSDTLTQTSAQTNR